MPYTKPKYHIQDSVTQIVVSFSGETLTSRNEAELIWVTYARKLTFSTNTELLVREVTGKLASLRRITWLIDAKRLEVLHNAQVRSSLEYACFGV